MDELRKKLDLMLQEWKESDSEIDAMVFEREVAASYRSGDLVTREEIKAAVEAERETCGRLVKNLAISPTEGAALQIAISTRGETNDQ